MDEVAICNLALSHLGAYPIQALTEATKEARECKRLYATARDSALEAHDWSFARKQKVLGLLVDTYSGWTYAYEWPSDCIIPRKIYDPSGDTADGTVIDRETDQVQIIGRIPFEVGANASLNRRVILTNEEDAELIYTAKVTDPNMFSPGFIDALSWRLASDLAMPLRADKALQQQHFNQFRLIIGQSQSSNANASHNKPDSSSSFVRARG